MDLRLFKIYLASNIEKKIRNRTIEQDVNNYYFLLVTPAGLIGTKKCAKFAELTLKINMVFACMFLTKFMAFCVFVGV